MKKSLIITVMFLITIQFIVSEQIDNIVLLDTSESMFPYYSGTIDYLIRDIIEQQLEEGDTFHLLSFNDYPEYEISRTIKTEKEIEEILNRILLLQPIGKYTDLISAFSYLYEYTEELQLNTIKRILILTDGIHDPPPGSPFPVSSKNSDNIVKIAENMRRQGWDVSLVQFPIQNNEITDTKTTNGVSSDPSTNVNVISMLPKIAETLDKPVITINGDEGIDSFDITLAPEIIYPDNIGAVGLSFKAVFEFINHSNESVLLKLTGINSPKGMLFQEPTSVELDSEETKTVTLILKLSNKIEKGNYNIPIELYFNDNLRAYPRKGKLEFSFDPQISSIKKEINTRIFLYIFIGIVLLIAVIYILVNIFKSFTFSNVHTNKKSGSEGFKQDSFGTPKTSKKYRNIDSEKKSGQIAIEMIVKNQNRQVGHRNIHIIGEAHPLSVGGAGSEYFLIFIIATGKRIGEIVMEEGIVSFVPKSEDFFPDLKGNKLTNCLSIPIKVINNNGIETSIVFNEWISPVDRLNRIMHLLDKSGLPDFRY